MRGIPVDWPEIAGLLATIGGTEAVRPVECTRSRALHARLQQAAEGLEKALPAPSKEGPIFTARRDTET
jgi:hypothetical protein